jgi:hypothetical protein
LTLRSAEPIGNLIRNENHLTCQLRLQVTDILLAIAVVYLNGWGALKKHLRAALEPQDNAWRRQASQDR